MFLVNSLMFLDNLIFRQSLTEGDHIQVAFTPLEAFKFAEPAQGPLVDVPPSAAVS
jgi:hypothetical protein